MKHRVFISIPTLNKSLECIESMREYLLKKTQEMLFAEFDIINPVDLTDYKTDPYSLWVLGRSLEFMSEADVVVFSSDWNDDRKCRFERKAAEEYHLATLELEFIQ